MEATDKVFAGPVPQVYDRLLVPLVFQPYAEDLAARVMAPNPERILELAAGTGALTRAMAERLDGASLVATDLNQPMLDLAATRLPDDDRISWHQADALELPFADESFDAAACQFGVMFFPDKPKSHREVWRVLRPGGRYLFNVWDAVASNDFVAVLLDALVEAFPSDPPRFIERTPHGYHDVGTIELDVMAGGFPRPIIERVEKRAHAASAMDVATGYCQGTPIRGEIEARGGPGLMAVTEAVARALERRFGAGPIEGALAAFVVSAERA
ncbi:MAG TPA: methyltransferase domain-containing protein [Bosea sp. (in: a-proteobacteria)]|jgi:SAM-dependent methyltransferase|uniref:class I SAM-dependent methyltransferase n=1 Tax=Bosea sp. (in: a-proteobacteria) TaxID=1871050 RepID=UPI002E149C63|nr:methyltransferase domain-containing protein [Bosea sp. (in: a-proteobacteria)]